MTVPVPCPGSTVDVSSSAPRKRRRRAPASGASDDCFACSKSNTKCDRRRPYCSQCLEFGTECSGYKTQLTWGVGVASRGKLRGLSLPIARSAPAPKSPSAKHARASTSTSIPKSVGSINGDTRENGGVKIKLEGQSPLPTSSYTTYDFINMVPNSPMGMNMPSMSTDWSMSMSPEYLRISQPSTPEPSHQQLLRQSLQRLHTPLISNGDDMNLSSSAGSISGYSDTDYSPMEHSFAADDVSYMASPMPIYHSYHSGQNSPVDHSFGMISDPRGPTSCPDQYYEQSEISSSLSSHPTVYDMNDNRQIVGSPALRERDILYDDEQSALSTSHDSDHFMSSSHVSHASWHSRTDEDYGSLPSAADSTLLLPSPETFHIPLAPDVSPRLSFWLNYYDKIICPITVAIDSPSNPYRQQILNLALESPSLQHAICALASCNLRMKRRQTHGRQEWTQPFELEMQDRINGGLQLISNVRTAPVQEYSSEGPADESAMQEEYQNRSQAVQLLNQQLGDPENARHDSVLATLLILCHYRMCESGIAQFKTQFAGVKKLLGMRSSGIETGKWGWMESLFTFFDAMTATVNDREAQLRGGYLDMIANPSSPSSALENLAGFDGKLFKIIATLGRLNLLSQHRPVLDPLRPRSLSFGRPLQSPGATRPRLAGQALVDYYKFHATKFDGNGFASTLDSDFLEPTEQFPSYTSPSNVSSPVSEVPPSSLPSVAGGDDSRPLFWSEWTQTRSLLQTWEFSPSSLAHALPIPCDQALTRDFAYVSEAFRYAALLYVERLACPNLPSSHLNFQNLVSQVLFFVEALGQGNTQSHSAHISGTREGSKMEKFLLWPLFVAGSECVSELHRDIVRARCRGLVGRSGYGNNFAGLEVLERIWKENGREEDRATPAGASPFTWTSFMNIEGVGGEYIMV